MPSVPDDLVPLSACGVQGHVQVKGLDLISRVGRLCGLTNQNNVGRLPRRSANESISVVRTQFPTKLYESQPGTSETIVLCNVRLSSQCR